MPFSHKLGLIAALLVAMFFIKLIASSAVGAFGAWIVIPVLGVVFLIARRIDRSAARRRSE